MSSVRTKLDSYKLLPKWIRYLSSYLNLFLCSVLLKPKIYGRKNIPQNGPYIVAINHFHIFDPALVAYAIRKPISFLAASDQDIDWQVLIAGKLYGFIPTNRQKLAPSTIKKAIQALQKGVPSEAITVFGMTQLGYYSRPRWITENPKTYIDSGYSGNLGFAFPTALGAKVGNPGKDVVCVSGDGGFMYNSSEISTAVKYGINLVTVIYNDGHYGNVARDLDDDFGGDYETEFSNPDFVKLAEAYGAIGLRAADPFDVQNVIPRALDLSLIHI